MAPTSYVFLDQLSLSPNGKIDRKDLPAPEIDTDSIRGYEPPQGEIETKLAAIWAEVLKLDHIGRHDDFFELGGHSLSAMLVVPWIRKSLNLDVPISYLFQSPTIESLAKAIERKRVSMHSEEEFLRILEDIEAMPASSAEGEP